MALQLVLLGQLAALVRRSMGEVGGVLQAPSAGEGQKGREEIRGVGEADFLAARDHREQGAVDRGEVELFGRPLGRLEERLEDVAGVHAANAATTLTRKRRNA